MNKSLLEIFKTFSKDEIKKFGEFVESPYFNKKSAVLKFWKIVSRHAPDFSSSELTREKIYGEIFPGKKYNYGTMKNLIFDLTRLVEKFLSVERLSKDKFQSDFNYLDELMQRSLGRIFILRYDELMDQCLESDEVYDNYYLNLSKLTSLKKDFEFIQSVREIDYKNTDQASEFLIFYLIQQIFAEYNNSLSIRIMANKKGAAPLLEKFVSSIDLKKVMSALKEISPKDYQRLIFGYKKYLAIANPDKPEFYFDYKSYLIANMDLLTNSEKYNNANGLMTALSELEIDSSLKTKEYNDVHKLRFKHDIIVSNEGLSPVVYSSFIGNAGITKDPDFLEEFMNKYFDLLHDDYKVNMKNFSLAYLKFAKNEFLQSLEYLNKIDFDIFQFKYNVRNLQMLIFYEINDYVGFSYAKDSYKHFLTNNKEINIRNKELNNNLINYIELMFQVRSSGSRIEAELFEKKLINEKVVAMKLWLLEKVKLLKETFTKNIKS